MQALQTATGRDEAESREPIRAWIEGRDGSIVRGLVELLSEDGALVRLTASDSVGAGDEVEVRLSSSRTAQSLAVGARVLSMRSQDDTSECEIEWTRGAERAGLASLIVTLG
jgi:hypothetical protein